MLSLRNSSISTRLMVMNTLVSSVALLLASAGFFTYDQITFRQSLIRTLSAQAQIVGSNSISAILFNDPQAAQSTLSALQSSQNIASAAIFTMNRQPLARYSRESFNELPDLPQLAPQRVQEYWIQGTYIILVRRILSEGNPIGFVYLRASLRDLDRRLKRYALIAFGVLAISLLAANVVSSSFRKSVAQPIVQLAETAQAISRDKNYNIRVSPPLGKNELAVLVHSFNEMLSELRKSHEGLEHRVSERTRDLVLANRELEAFSYSVSHDLRGPLDAINGFSYLLLNQYSSGLDAQRRELVENIRASSRRMTALIDDLLNLSRVTSSAMRSERVDLSAVASSIIEELCLSNPGRKVDFTAADNAEVPGDSRLLRILMDNLLRNSWKYTSHHDGARIEFGTMHDGKQTVYFVKDDGSGFDPRAADRLFQPFQRLHSPDEFPGNGVGLAIVRRIVQRHGGDVWAEGAVEKGATFYFTINSPLNYSAP
jgi:signal transduction histidine kinase